MSRAALELMTQVSALHPIDLDAFLTFIAAAYPPDESKEDRARRLARERRRTPGPHSEKRASAGKLGAAKRWQTDGKPDGKPDGKHDEVTMANEDTLAMANAPAPRPRLIPISLDLPISQQIRDTLSGIAGLGSFPDATTLHDAVELALGDMGYRVTREYPISDRGDGKGGRVDLMAERDGGARIALELDFITPRGGSILKLASIPGVTRVVILREGAGGATPGMDFVIAMEPGKVISCGPATLAEPALALPAPIGFPADILQLREVYCTAVASVTGMRYGIPVGEEQSNSLLEALRQHGRDDDGPFTGGDLRGWLRVSVTDFAKYVMTKQRGPDAKFWRPTPKCFLNWLNETPLTHDSVSQ